MATLEVTIRYRPPVARVALGLLTVVSVLLVLLPLLSFLLSVFGVDLREAGLSGLMMFLSSIFGGLPLVILGLGMWQVAKDNKMVLSQQGVCFPSFFALLLWGRRNRPWYDLKAVELVGPEEADVKRKSLRLRFSSGGSISLRLADLQLTEIEQVILAIETFASGLRDSAALLETKRELSDKLRIEGVKSYTNLWEDELRYRYSSTTFIPLAPNQKLQNDKLKVIRQLGFGGLSAIYLVQQSGRDLLVLKESTVPGDVDPEVKEKAIEMFDREARILAKLNHSQIAKVYDHFVENGRHYLLLQYVHGQDLRQKVKQKGPMDEAKVLDCAVQMADILAYLHSQEPAVIHRDLTPENLVINDAGKIVLIDFGAANEFLQTATGTLVGKHAYIAPEQFRGKATTCSDIYSMGGTLHFLLTGMDPVALSSSSPRKSNPAVTQEMDDLVNRLTKTATKDRVQTAEEAGRQLRELAALTKGSV